MTRGKIKPGNGIKIPIAVFGILLLFYCSIIPVVAADDLGIQPGEINIATVQNFPVLDRFMGFKPICNYTEINWSFLNLSDITIEQILPKGPVETRTILLTNNDRDNNLTDLSITPGDLVTQDNRYTIPAPMIFYNISNTTIKPGGLETVPVFFTLYNVHSGDYTGNLQVSSNTTSKPLRVEIKIKDAPILPFLVLAIVSFLSVLLSGYLTSGRERDEIKIHLLGKLEKEFKQVDYLQHPTRSQRDFVYLFRDPIRSRIDEINSLLESGELTLAREKYGETQNMWESWSAPINKSLWINGIKDTGKFFDTDVQILPEKGTAEREGIDQVIDTKKTELNRLKQLSDEKKSSAENEKQKLEREVDLLEKFPLSTGTLKSRLRKEWELAADTFLKLEKGEETDKTLYSMQLHEIADTISLVYQITDLKKQESTKSIEIIETIARKYKAIKVSLNKDPEFKTIFRIIIIVWVFILLFSYEVLWLFTAIRGIFFIAFPLLPWLIISFLIIFYRELWRFIIRHCQSLWARFWLGTYRLISGTFLPAVILIIIGFTQLYSTNPVFGAKGAEDYATLVFWAFVTGPASEKFSQVVQKYQVTPEEEKKKLEEGKKNLEKEKEALKAEKKRVAEAKKNLANPPPANTQAAGEEDEE